MESITIESTDKKFLVKLIDFLNKSEVEPNSTTITFHNTQEDKSDLLFDK